MPKQVNAGETTSTRTDDGPEWSPNGVELLISEADRAALEDYGTQNLLTAVEEVLAAAAAMRRREAPADPNPQRALEAATFVAKWMEGAQRELLVSGLVTHGQAAAAMGVVRATAQKRRQAAELAESVNGLDTYQWSVSHRPKGTTPANWYGDATAAPEAPVQLSVHVPGGDLPVTVETNQEGRRMITTEARVLVINGERVVVRPGETKHAQGFKLYGGQGGIWGFEE